MATFREFVAAQLQELGSRLSAEHERLLHKDHAWADELQLQRSQRVAAESRLQQAEIELEQLRSEKDKILSVMGFSLTAAPPSMMSLENVQTNVPVSRVSSQASCGQRADPPAALSNISITPPRSPRLSNFSRNLPLQHGQKHSQSNSRPLCAEPQRVRRRSRTWDKDRRVSAIPEENSPKSQQSLLTPSPPMLSRLTSDEKKKAPLMKALKKRRFSAPTLAPMPETASALAPMPKRVVEDSVSEAESWHAPQHSPSIASGQSGISVATSQYVIGVCGPHVNNLSNPSNAGTSENSRNSASSNRSWSKQDSILGVSLQQQSHDTTSETNTFSEMGPGSPGSPAHSFKTLGHWEEREKPKSRLMPSSFTVFQPIYYDTEHDESGFCKARMLHRLVISPSSSKRSFWDLASLVFAVYDAIVIPLQFIDFQRKGVLMLLSWFPRLFWTFDLLASFLTGFAMRSGSVEMRPAKIALRYLRTWFSLDLIMVVSDWSHITVSTKGEALHFMQMLLMLRLLRLTRIQRVLDLIIDWASSEKVGVMVSLWRSLSGIVLVTHVMACCWIGLGNLDGRGWVLQEGIEEEFWHQYAISFHWSLTQFYGAMELEPTNLGERFYAIGSLLAGFVLATAFVSSITSSMTRLYIITSQQSGQFKVLSRYLKEHGISRKLATRVQMNAQHAIEQQQRNVPENDVELLNFVSAPLRVELHYEIYSPVLLIHPLFHRLQDSNPAVMRQICHSAVSMMTVERDDVLFSCGQVPGEPEMLFVCSGSLAYSQDGERFQEVVPGEWICEHVLWTEWVYHGILHAKELCHLAVLDAQTFSDVVSKCPSTTASLSHYARQFLQVVNNSPNIRSDLGSSMDYASLMVLSLPSESVELAPSGGSWWQRRVSKQISPKATSFTKIVPSG